MHCQDHIKQHRRMLRGHILDKEKKSKLKITESTKFQSLINRQNTDQYRLFNFSPSTSLQPSKPEFQKHIIRQKQTVGMRNSILAPKQQANLQDLILLKQFVFQGSSLNQQKAQLQKYLQKDKKIVDRSSSLLKKNFSLPKLHLDQKEPIKHQSLSRVQKKKIITRPAQEVLLIKLINKMRQHILLRKEGQFIYISLKELLRFLNFLISLIKCQREDKVAKIFQIFPHYGFFKDSVLEVFRYYQKSNYQSIDTKKSLGTKLSVNKPKSKSNINLRKKQKENPTKRSEVDMNKTSISLKLKQSEIIDKEIKKQRVQQKIEKQISLPKLQLDKQFDQIQAMLQEYILLKNCEHKQNNKKRFSIKYLEQHIIHEMEIFHKKILNDPLLVPDVKHKLLRNIIQRAFQRRVSRDHQTIAQSNKNGQKQQILSNKQQIMQPFFRLKQIVKEQLLQKNFEKSYKKCFIQKTKAVKQILKRIIKIIEEIKQIPNLTQKQRQQIKHIYDFCNTTSTKCISFRLPEE